MKNLENQAIFLLIFLCLGCFSSNKEVYDIKWHPLLYEEAVHDFEDHNWLASALKFEAIVSAQPNNFHAAYFTARAYANLSDTLNCFKWIQNCQNLGYLYLNSDDFTLVSTFPTYEHLKAQAIHRLDSLESLPIHPHLILPEDFDSTKSYKVLVFLMGFGGDHQIKSPSWYHDFATDQQLVWMVIRGNKIMGVNSYSWELTEAEKERVVQNIMEVKTQIQVEDLILYGFQQGARIGYRLISSYPSLFDKMITLSQSPYPNDLQGSESLEGIKMYHLCGNSPMVDQYKKAFAADSKWSIRAAHSKIETQYRLSNGFPNNSLEATLTALKWIED